MSWKLVTNFADIPVPPSLNNAYANIPGHGRVPTKDLMRFKKAFSVWHLQRSRLIRSISKDLAQHKLKIEITISLPGEKLYTKAGKPRRFDISNRIKILEDAICGALGLDDSWVWEVRASKAQSETPAAHVAIFRHSVFA